VGGTSSLRLTVKNSGTADLVPGTISLAGANADDAGHASAHANVHRAAEDFWLSQSFSS
jgi:hypothetical protein